MKVKLPFCIILLMIAGVAWADSKVLWRGSSSLCGGHFYSTPEAARKACGYTRKGWKLEKRGEFTYEMGWYNEDGSFYKWTGAYVLGKIQSCELKDIPGDGSNGTHDLNFPGRTDEAPKMVRRCINNCEVEDRRVAKNGEAHDKDYGGSVCVEIGSYKGCSGSYTRIQTGAVCTLKPGEKDDTKYDDVTDQPADDNGNGADGKGKQDGGGKSDENNQGKQPESGNGGDENKDSGQGSGNAGSGNQNGGQGGTGADSPRDSGSADEVDDKDKNKDKDKPGKGKGKGGGGGGKHGDKDKDDKDKADDGKGGDPKGGEGKGDGKGDGKDGGKDGKDKADGSPNGTDNGTGAGGDKDGQGSGISGGDCKSGKAPSCKGET